MFLQVRKLKLAVFLYALRVEINDAQVHLLCVWVVRTTLGGAHKQEWRQCHTPALYKLRSSNYRFGLRVATHHDQFSVTSCSYILVLKWWRLSLPHRAASGKAPTGATTLGINTSGTESIGWAT